MQRYECRDCSSQKKALQRNMQKLKNVPTMSPQNSVSVPTENKPVYTPYIAKTREEVQQIVYANRARIARLLEERLHPLPNYL